MKNHNILSESLNQQPEESSMLYRYMTIDKLMDFLFNGRIPLVRLDSFEDKLEGITIEHLLLNSWSNERAKQLAGALGPIGQLFGVNVNPAKRNELRRQRIEFQKANYVSCWYINDHESVAMWQIYSKPDSVAVKIPYDAFSNTIKHNEFTLTGYNQKKIKMGKVHYVNFNKIKETTISPKEDTQGFIKDLSFSHEQEYRLMLQIEPILTKSVEKGGVILDEQADRIDRQNDMRVIHMHFREFDKMNFEIIFHPQSSDWHRRNVISMIEKYNLPFKAKESVLKEIFEN